MYLNTEPERIKPLADGYLLCLISSSCTKCHSPASLPRCLLSFPTGVPLIRIDDEPAHMLRKDFGLSVFQGRPITPVYTVAPNVQRIPTAGIYGASYVPFAAPATATIATLQKNAAAAVYGGYAGYIPQAFPAALQVPIHDVYQTY